jgi:hypothetical protein
MESPMKWSRRWFHRWFRRWQCHVTVHLSQFESLDHSISKIVWRHHVVVYFQKTCIPRRRNGQYIPTKIFYRYIPIVSPTDLGRRYIPTDFETELFSSGIITDEKIPLVIPLVFSGFLVVIKYGRMKLGKKTKEKPQVNPSYYDKPVT